MVPFSGWLEGSQENHISPSEANDAGDAHAEPHQDLLEFKPNRPPSNNASDVGDARAGFQA